MDLTRHFHGSFLKNLSSSIRTTSSATNTIPKQWHWEKRIGKLLSWHRDHDSSAHLHLALSILVLSSSIGTQTCDSSEAPFMHSFNSLQ